MEETGYVKKKIVFINERMLISFLNKVNEIIIFYGDVPLFDTYIFGNHDLIGLLKKAFIAMNRYKINPSRFKLQYCNILEDSLRYIKDVSIHKDALSTIDIDNILTPYTYLYPYYISLGSTGSDYCNYEYNYELCNISIHELLRRNIRCFSAIINTDISNGRGKHWSLLWVDFRKDICPIIMFWDSLGTQPSYITIKTIHYLKNELRTLYNKIRVLLPSIKANPHQYTGSTCGLYCIYILELLLAGISPEILNSRISRKFINDISISEYFNTIF